MQFQWILRGRWERQEPLSLIVATGCNEAKGQMLMVSTSEDIENQFELVKATRALEDDAESDREEYSSSGCRRWSSGCRRWIIS